MNLRFNETNMITATTATTAVDEQPNGTFSPASLFVSGTTVKIDNLVGAPQYNDEVGLVKYYNPGKGRYAVKLLSNSKELLLKPENLRTVCNKCIIKEVPLETMEQTRCQRCHMTYCSVECRNDDWEHHKAICVPIDLPTAPGPVKDSDTGEDAFEASKAYIELATDAGNDGRYMEQIVLNETLLEKDPKQPGAYFQLFQRYSSTHRPFFDSDKAFSNLQKAVSLLSDPTIVEPSGSRSTTIPRSDIVVDDSMTLFRTMIIREGNAFIENHRVVGKSGEDLEAEKEVMVVVSTWATEMVESLNVDDDDEETAISKFELSDFDLANVHSNLCNIFRKMSMNQAAIDVYRMSEGMIVAITDGKRHNYDALRMIPEMLLIQARSEQLNPRENMQQAVDEARKCLAILKEKAAEGCSRYPVCVGEVLLAKTMFVQCQMRFVAEDQLQETLREIHTMALSGYNAALELGLTYEVRSAEGVLQGFKRK